ncbi:MAG: hypothetical protein ACJ8AK_15375 [Gemmatimonadaceae bacterium]
MKKLLLILGLVGVVGTPDNARGQQTSIAFVHPTGIQSRTSKTGGIDTVRRDTVRKIAVDGPSRAPYVVFGAVLGGLAGAGLFAYEISEGLKHGGEWMALPTIGIARDVGGGLVVGGFLGLVYYYIRNP